MGNGTERSVILEQKKIFFLDMDADKESSNCEECGQKPRNPQLSETTPGSSDRAVLSTWCLQPTAQFSNFTHFCRIKG